MTVLDKVLHFALTKDSLIKGLDKGWNTERIIKYLSSVSNSPVPAPVLKFLETVGKKKGEAKLYACSALIKCEGLGLREKILAVKNISAFKIEGLADYLCVLDKSASEVEKILKKKGIFAEIVSLSSHAGEKIPKLLKYYMRRDQEVIVTYLKGAKRIMRSVYIEKISGKKVTMFDAYSDIDDKDIVLPVSAILEVKPAPDYLT